MKDTLHLSNTSSNNLLMWHLALNGLNDILTSTNHQIHSYSLWFIDIIRWFFTFHIVTKSSKGSSQWLVMWALIQYKYFRNVKVNPLFRQHHSISKHVSCFLKINNNKSVVCSVLPLYLKSFSYYSMLVIV